jgi:hypothetical protein
VATDTEIYGACVVRIRERLNIVQKIVSGEIQIGHNDQRIELIFVQFRKVLEEIAFASLSANKEKYCEVHANFSKHWRAKDMLAVMDTLNPNFYPVPLPPPITTAPGRHHFGEPLADGFVTRDDFVFLYNCSSEALHTRNPYRKGDPTIQIKYTVEEWILRFRRLLSWHSATLLNGDRWVVHMPAEGDVHVYPATPRS